MRKVLLGLLAVSIAIPASSQTYGLGVGAASADSVVLKIDGKNRTIHLGTGADTQSAEVFLTCLVTSRVIKVEGSGSKAKLLMLDGHNVADLVREYVQTKTAADPCTLGKGAYTPRLGATASVAAAPVKAAPVKAAPAKTAPAAETATTPDGKKRLAGGRPAAEVLREDEKMSILGVAVSQGAQAAPAAPAATATQPEAPVMSTLPTSQVEKPTAAPVPTAPPVYQPTAPPVYQPPTTPPPPS